jgi:hypothetical protein
MSNRFFLCRTGGGVGAKRTFGVFAVILIIKLSKKNFLNILTKKYIKF